MDLVPTMQSAIPHRESRSGLSTSQEAHMIEFLLITWALIRFWIL